MIKYQLWSRDEYGQGSILNTSEDLQELIKDAKNLVDEANVNNALTAEEKKRNWTSYFVELEPVKAKKTTQIIYSGRNSQNKHSAFKVTASKNDIVAIDKDTCNVKVFLGNLDKEPWYAVDARRNEINSLDNADLVDKTVYYIRQIG